MKFEEFRKKYQPWGVIPGDLVVHENPGENAQSIRNQLSRWTKKGLLRSLKKGLYVFDFGETTASVDARYLANRLYEPSYVSLEYALSFYGLIPERVFSVTSVTTLKTKTFRNKFGNFVYQHIKPEAFRGFVQKTGDGGVTILVAAPEKAVLDFLYLNLSKFSGNAEETLLSSYRFEGLEALDPKMLAKWGGLYGSKKLSRVVQTIKNMIQRKIS